MIVRSAYRSPEHNRAVGGAKPFATEWAMRFQVKDGKLTRCRVYEDTAVTAAALRP
jgi:ketosteroid isomerase-like protein